MDATTAIILAAGKGTRMDSDLPKVLHEVAGRPMLIRVLDNLRDGGINNHILVVGHGSDLVRSTVIKAGLYPQFAYQAEQKGTGHAVMCALPFLSPNAKNVIVTYGDKPLMSGATFIKLVKKQQKTKAKIVLSTVVYDSIMGAAPGRIVRDKKGRIKRIAEQKLCIPRELSINEGNGGAVVYDTLWLRGALPKVKQNQTGEYFLTDLVEIAYKQDDLIDSVIVDQAEAQGVNTMAHLRKVEGILDEGLFSSSATM